MIIKGYKVASVIVEGCNTLQVRRLNDGYLYSVLSMKLVEYSTHLNTFSDVERLCNMQFGDKSERLIVSIKHQLGDYVTF